MNQAKFPQRFPVLETERLILRAISVDDTQAIFDNFSDPDVAKWFFQQPITEVEQAARFVEGFISDFNQGRGLTWALELKGTGCCVGTCGYGGVQVGHEGEIGFDLAKAEWGKGLMSEALVAVVDYGFDSLGLSQVEAHTFSENRRAIALLKRVGFQVDRIEEGVHFFSISRK